MKKPLFSTLAMCFLLYVGNAQVPDGDCMECESCSGYYYVCESNVTDAYFDIMNNCGPNSDVEIEEISNC